MGVFCCSFATPPRSDWSAIREGGMETGSVTPSLAWPLVRTGGVDGLGVKGRLGCFNAAFVLALFSPHPAMRSAGSVALG